MAKKKPAKNQPTVDDLKAPLLAAVGAADLALERVNEIVSTLRERAERGPHRRRGARRGEPCPPHQAAGGPADACGGLRERLTSDELRKVAESYAEAAPSRYNKLVERGEAALERLRTPARVSKRAASGSRAIPTRPSS